jgi:hypothetical protein
MAIKLQGLETDLKVDTNKWDAGFKGAIALTATLLASVAALGTGIFKLGQATFQWAGQMDSLQDITGITNKEAAALNFTLRKSGVEVDKLKTGMTILGKELVNANGELDTSGKKLAEFGINALDANGALKDQTVLFKEISDKYNALGTQTERVNLLTEIFGKSGAELVDVFDTLAAEGGLDKVTDKVSKLGLVIDPAKYEKFTRNLEEIKLAALGLGITFIDNLMPALESANKWWEQKGLPAFLSMRKWMAENIPPAVETVKKTFDRLGITWNTTIKPAADELVRAYNLLVQAGERLSPSTEGTASKFTILGASVRIVIGLGAMVANALEIMTTGLRILNTVLSTAIGLWDRFRGAAASATAVAQSVPTPSGGSTGTRTSPARSGRAWGGAMQAGQGYNVFERGRKSEVFVPNTSGHMATQMEVTLSDRDLDRIGNSASKGAARGIAAALQRRVPA